MMLEVKRKDVALAKLKEDIMSNEGMRCEMIWYVTFVISWR